MYRIISVIVVAAVVVVLLRSLRYKQCPHCKKLVRKDATACPYCTRDL
jgi:hypothetical protein